MMRSSNYFCLRFLAFLCLAVWCVLVGLVPVAGTIWLLVKMCEAPAQVGLNRFGPDPRYAAPGLSQTRLAALPGQVRVLVGR